jgi:hypothetical protein
MVQGSLLRSVDLEHISTIRLGSDAQINCGTPTTTPNSANCFSAMPVGNVTNRGSYPGSP